VDPFNGTAAGRTQRRRRLASFADRQEDIVSRRQLLELGVTRWDIRAELSAGRWRAHGRQAIAMHAGPLTEAANRWVCLFEAGPSAVLDGVAALQVAGLTGYDDVLRISLPRGARIHGRPQAVVRRTRRLTPEAVVGVGIPRTRPDVAAVHAALWARTDRQAAFILVLRVSQGLASPASIQAAFEAVRRDRRRAFISVVLRDLQHGVRALGELDFARLCREHSLPEPDRQVERRGAHGRIYLDVRWAAYRLVVEIDGIHHAEPVAVVSDALRQNHVVLDDDTVLRIPLLGLRTQADDFMNQVRRALISRGWRPHA
jgi:very-short-patch-repair endonuclease